MSSVSKRPNGKWRARYRDESGKEHARHFDRKLDAKRWLDEVTASVVTGQYIDPKAGKITLKQYAEAWRQQQVQHRPTTRAYIETNLRRHVYPYLGDRTLVSITPQDIRIWLTRLSIGDLSADPKVRPIAASTISTIHGVLSGIFRCAIRDRRVALNPCEATRLPKPKRTLIMPPSTETVDKLINAAPQPYRAMVVLGAGSGMRNGEILGLTRDRIDFLRRTVTVDRQLVSVSGQEPFLAPPKTTASVRVIPLPQVVVDALSVHVSDFGIGEQDYMFTFNAKPISRSGFGHSIWRPLVLGAETPGLRFHDLRHFYASLLIRYGESIKTVQARLGHANASETLDTYSHLWPDADDRTREAVEQALGLRADQLRTEFRSS